MKKILITLVAVSALAVPTAASAHGGRGHHWGWHHKALLAKVTGTGASLANTTAALSGTIASDKLGTGTFAATVTTDWTKAVTRTGDKGVLSCAPASTALSLTGATTTNTLSATLTGKTCKWTPTGGQTVAAFFGRGTATGAGALADLTGKTAKAFLWQKADGSVQGAVFAGHRDHSKFGFFARGEREASHKTGNCGH